MGYNKERYVFLKNVGFHIAVAVWYLVSLLPFWALHLISDVLFVLIYHVIGYRKKVVRENLASSFPEKTAEVRLSIERDFFRFLCDYLMESIKMMSISPEEQKAHMIFENTDLLDACIEQGRTCGIFMGHYCNYEWVASLPLWVSRKGQVSTIYHPLENQVADRLFLCTRQHFGTVCFAMQDTLRKVLEYHKKGQPLIIGYISDQKPFWTSIHHWVDFLNHDTPVLTGTERVMRKMDQAVFYLDMRRIGRSRYVGTFKPITMEPKKMREFELTDIYHQMLEESIRRDPAPWLWSHKRWSRTREEFNRLYEVVDGKVIKKAEN
jgi:KDO2-lipid IV(A) lauroyltransferase